MIAAQLAITIYASRVSAIRATMDPASRAFAVAMTDTCAEYERAMVADIGRRAAEKLGAGMVRL